MRIAITGGNGLLGGEICTSAKKQDIPVKKVIRERINPKLGLMKVKTFIRSLDCDVFIHCAANTNVDECETNEHECFHDNILLPELLAEICDLLCIKFVFISSTGIYGNYKTTPYVEYDDVNPTTIHHRSKFIAEQRVQCIHKNPLIIRTGWLFGGLDSNPKNFVNNRKVEALKSNGLIYSDNQQFGNPTYAVDVAERILLLLSDNISGVFNCVNEGVATRYEYVSEIIKTYSLDVDVRPLEKSFKRIAPVSFNESAINFKMNSLGYPPFLPWQIRLSEYIKQTSET